MENMWFVAAAWMGLGTDMGGGPTFHTNLVEIAKAG